MSHVCGDKIRAICRICCRTNAPLTEMDSDASIFFSLNTESFSEPNHICGKCTAICTAIFSDGTRMTEV